VWVRKKEGESGLKWGQQWQMGGSHHEVVEAVALGRELERRRGLRRWRRGGEELVLGCRTERSEALMASSIRRARGGESEREVGGGGGSARACHAAEGEREKRGSGTVSAAKPLGQNGSK
jgi:hypothetical protein